MPLIYTCKRMKELVYSFTKFVDLSGYKTEKAIHNIHKYVGNPILLDLSYLNFELRLYYDNYK